jgi:site-specific DNA-methyltransferase (adenine-specific)
MTGLLNSPKLTSPSQWPPAGIKWYFSDDYVAIAHADCRDILPSLLKVDLVLTDPPYGIDLDNHGAFKGSVTVNGDKNTTLADSIIQWANTLSLTTAVFCSPDLPYAGIWNNRLVWHKAGRGIGGDWTMCWLRDWELILVKTYKPIKRKTSSVLEFTPADCQYHKCEKPVDLLQYLIDQLSENTATILDPFMGSGTTLRAAKNLGRKAIGIEIEERYAEIAARRMQQSVLPLEYENKGRTLEGLGSKKSSADNSPMFNL